MKIHTKLDPRSSWLITFNLLGVVLLLAACGPAVAVPVVPVVENPPTPTPEPLSFNELWESSPHSDETAEAFRHWDAAVPQEIPVECARCHSRTGFLDYLGVDESEVNVVDKPAKIGTTITCYVCHNEATYTLDSVTFPSGKRVGGLGPEARCLTCHQGRASTPTLNIRITTSGAISEDIPVEGLLFLNSHSTSGATPFGSEVQGAYEYDGRTYQGRFNRGEEFFSCIRCHDQHSLKVKIETCGDCHTFDGVEVKNIRVNTTDFDGDADVAEGVYYEVEEFKTKLLAAIQAYARDVVKVPIAYDFAHHPYFYTDTNGNGLVDPEEVSVENRYSSWTPRLLRAAYNYNYSTHDTGAFAHNSLYILQVLYDSLADIGADTSGLSRP